MPGIGTCLDNLDTIFTAKHIEFTFLFCCCFCIRLFHLAYSKIGVKKPASVGVVVVVVMVNLFISEFGFSEEQSLTQSVTCSVQFSRSVMSDSL